jgi:pyruvate ferredoxin oxidoreductase alpha subunit
MGSVAGTIKDTIDELNAAGGKFGVLSIVCYRPFPTDAIKNAVKNAKKIIVIEKAIAVGLGGILFREIELVVKDMNIEIASVIAGLGGRAITVAMLKEYLTIQKHESEIFLGINDKIIEQEYKPIHACQ